MKLWKAYSGCDGFSDMRLRTFGCCSGADFAWISSRIRNTRGNCGWYAFAPRKFDTFEKLISYTTDRAAAEQKQGSYHYVTEGEFRRMNEVGEFFESTTYARHSYGSRKADVEGIFAKGKHVLTVMDICGAMALKTHFSNVITIYIKRQKRELLTAILEEDTPLQDKVNRLLAIDSERRNAEICDYVVDMDTPEQAAEQICRSLKIY